MSKVDEYINAAKSTEEKKPMWKVLDWTATVMPEGQLYIRGVGGLYCGVVVPKDIAYELGMWIVENYK